jgi:hypothetical protein
MNNRIALMMAAGLATTGAAFAGDCPGDCNGDGVANILDFVCFQNEWQGQTALGDCDGNGDYNILDFVCFQNEWQIFADGGCGGGDDPLDDTFDDFDLGSICGQGGWESWDANPDVCGEISDEQAFSGDKSLKIDGTQGVFGDDTVHLFDISGGQYTARAMTYVPSGQSGSAYWLLLNQYVHGGPYNWSTQVRFDPGLGIVESEGEGTIAVIVEDEWVEIKTTIDLDADVQENFYNGESLGTKSWIDGVSGGGTATIQCMDLYANEPGAGIIMYFDDVSVKPGLN